MKVYFDACVIIAALLSKTGGSALLLEYARQRRITGITSQTAIEEILDKTKKLGKSKAELEEFIADSGLVIRQAVSVEEIMPYRGLVDLDDAHLIAGANLTECSHLVTLDKKHLLRDDIQLRFLPLKIISPKDLLEEILNNG